MGRSRSAPTGLTGNLFASRAGFRSEYLDFDRGIHVGNLEPGERITQILKHALTERHGVRMVCDRWGRGVYWQWICWVPEPNRRAKPSSSGLNFASAKFFVAIDQDDRIFQAGMQVERAPRKPAKDDWPVRLEEDWDWHVLLRALRGKELPRLLGRLLGDGCRIRVGAFGDLKEFRRRGWQPAACLRAAAFPAADWGGFQLFYPMSEADVRATPGPEIIDAVLAVFEEVVPAMNLCMYAPCLQERGPGTEGR